MLVGLSIRARAGAGVPQTTATRRHGMDLVIPAALHQSCLQRGPEGTAWLAQLPHRVAAAAQAWGLRLGPAVEHGGAASWVAPVARADGAEAILKISLPHEDARYEAAALRLLDGRGAVRL